MILRARWLQAVGFLVLGAAAGCGPASDMSGGVQAATSSAPNTSSTAAKPTSVDSIPFDPCTAVPVSIVASFDVMANAPKMFRTEAGKSTMVGCTWEPGGIPPKFGIQIAKNLRTPAEFRANQVYETNEDTVVNGIPSVQFRSVNRGECSIAMPLPTGSAVVRYSNTDYSLDLPLVDSCPQALELARAVEPYLPKAG